MTVKHVAKQYLHHLERGAMQQVIDLFSEDGVVHSPIYGTLPAKTFYNLLSDDTQESKLELKDIFETPNSNKLALYFNYAWTLKNGDLVNFAVVDIIEFNDQHKITDLKIIYDTQHSRKAIAMLKS